MKQIIIGPDHRVEGEKKAPNRKQREGNGIIAVMRINIEMKITNNTIHISIMNQKILLDLILIHCDRKPMADVKRCDDGDF